MPAVTRQGDYCSGHGCYKPRPSLEASANVRVNGKGVVREGDRWQPHSCKGKSHTNGQSKTPRSDPYAAENPANSDEPRTSQEFYLPYAATVTATPALPGPPWERGPLDGAGHPLWNNTLPQWNYYRTVAEARAWQALHPEFQIDVIGSSYNGLPILAARLFDDGYKPIIGLSNGIHGDEHVLSLGIAEIYRYLTLVGEQSPDPWLSRVAATHAFYFILTVNPDGMAASNPSEYGGTGTRGNGRDVNLNRNFPYAWDYGRDLDRGSAAASEPETQAIIAWLSTDYRVQRIVEWLDCHGWNSRTTWGLLQEQIYTHPRAQNTQRGILLYSNGILAQRDWTGIQIVNAPPILTEYRSHHRPYLYTWVRTRCRKEGWGGILEYPQTENVWLSNLVFFDLFRGLCMAACDLLQPVCEALSIERASDPPLNSNSFFSFWDPNFLSEDFSYNGVRMTHVPATGSDPTYVQMDRPIDYVWPVAVYGAAYTQGGPHNAITLLGGINRMGTRTLINTEYSPTLTELANQLQGDSLLKPVNHAAAASSATHLYYSGGYSWSAQSGDIYHENVYRIPYPTARDRLTGWETLPDLPAGVQRHTMHVWGNFLILIGGRTSSAYLDSVRAYSLTTGAITTLGTMQTVRGWHTSVLIGDEVFIFGGWNGANTLTACERFNLTTGVSTPLTPLPFSRAEQALAYHPASGIVYLCFGRTGSAYKNTIFRYTVATNTFETWDLTILAEEDVTQDDATSDPIDTGELIGCAAWIDSYNHTLLITGGMAQTNLYSERVWEIDLNGDTLYQRHSNIGRWGYLRTRDVIFPYLSADNSFTVLASVRNTFPTDTLLNPYIRLHVAVYALGSDNIIRKIRLGYTVPPTAGSAFYTYTLPFTLEAGEDYFIPYLRLYSGGTSIQVSNFQVIAGVGVCRPVPLTGRVANLAYTATLAEPLGNPALADLPWIQTWTDDPATIPAQAVDVEFDAILGWSYRVPDFLYTKTYFGVTVHSDQQAVSGILAPAFGCQMNVSQALMTFQLHAGMELTNLELWYEATAGTPAPDPYSGFMVYPPNGRFFLKWRHDGEWSEQTLVANLPLNHARLNREFRRDVLYWQLASEAALLTFSLAFYGQVYSWSRALSCLCLGFQCGSGTFARALSPLVADVHEGEGTGSRSVFVNGRALMRIGDPVCDSVVAQGSSNVFAGA